MRLLYEVTIEVGKFGEIVGYGYQATEMLILK